MILIEIYFYVSVISTLLTLFVTSVMLFKSSRFRHIFMSTCSRRLTVFKEQPVLSITILICRGFILGLLSCGIYWYLSKSHFVVYVVSWVLWIIGVMVSYVYAYGYKGIDDVE